jgi:methionyl-tRNA synthetase
MYVKKFDRSSTTFEYGINTQRNFPWEGVVTPPFGNSWAIVGPGMNTEPNAHDEAEVFIVIHGEGLMRVGDEEQAVGAGDIIYAPPFVEHTVRNTGDGEFLMLSIWWEPEGAKSGAQSAQAGELV